MTQAGLQEIINIKASLNNGNLGELKVVFPATMSVPRPLVKFTGIPDPH